MSIHLISGIQRTIHIEDTSGNVLYKQSCASENELKTFIEKYGKSKDGWSLIEGAVLPLRTHNFKDFAKDFFLPTFVNFSLKISNVALRVISSIFALAFDAITAPMRLVATPFRVYFNEKYPESKLPITSLLKNDSRYTRIVEDDLIKLCYTIEDVKIKQIYSNEADEDENHFEEATKCTVKGQMEIILKKVPGGALKKSNEVETTESYIGSNGDWVLQGRGEHSSKNSSYSC